MKEKVILIIFILNVLFLTSSTNSQAASLSLYCNGKISKTVTPLFVRGDEVMVPVTNNSFILDIKTSIDKTSNKVIFSKGTRKVTVDYNAGKAFYDNVEMNFNISPVIKYNQYYISLKFLAKLFKKSYSLKDNKVYLGNRNFSYQNSEYSKINGVISRSKVSNVNTTTKIVDRHGKTLETLKPYLDTTIKLQSTGDVYTLISMREEVILNYAYNYIKTNFKKLLDSGEYANVTFSFNNFDICSIHQIYKRTLKDDMELQEKFSGIKAFIANNNKVPPKKYFTSIFSEINLNSKVLPIKVYGYSNSNAAFYNELDFYMIDINDVKKIIPDVALNVSKGNGFTMYEVSYMGKKANFRLEQNGSVYAYEGVFWTNNYCQFGYLNGKTFLISIVGLMNYLIKENSSSYRMAYDTIFIDTKPIVDLYTTKIGSGFFKPIQINLNGSLISDVKAFDPISYKDKNIFKVNISDVEKLFPFLKVTVQKYLLPGNKYRYLFDYKNFWFDMYSYNEMITSPNGILYAKEEGSISMGSFEPRDGIHLVSIVSIVEYMGGKASYDRTSNILNIFMTEKDFKLGYHIEKGVIFCNGKTSIELPDLEYIRLNDRKPSQMLIKVQDAKTLFNFIDIKYIDSNTVQINFKQNTALLYKDKTDILFNDNLYKHAYIDYADRNDYYLCNRNNIICIDGNDFISINAITALLGGNIVINLTEKPYLYSNFSKDTDNIGSTLYL